MTTSLRALKMGALACACAASAALTGCGDFSPLSGVVIPNFSDENLGNPMADFMPAGGGVPVVNQGPGADAAPAATGLLDQASGTGGLGSADAALLDAALDLSPSQMGSSGASVGLLSPSTLSGQGRLMDQAGGAGVLTPADEALIAAAGLTLPATPGLPASLSVPTPRPAVDASPSASEASAPSPSLGFERLTAEEAERMIAEGGTMRYTVVETASLETPPSPSLPPALPLSAPPTAAFVGQPAPALVSLSGTEAVGTSPEMALAIPDQGPNSSGLSFDPALVPALPQRKSQALIPVFGGAEPLSIQPTRGVFSPGFAQFRAGSIEFSLSFPAQVAVGQIYDSLIPSVTMTMRNVDSVPKTFQPDNILNQFPPFHIYRWTGSSWASLTVDVAYNLDRQGISAPLTLQPGQSVSRTEPLAKLALLPLMADFPPTQSLAIRLQVMGQPEAFTMVDSGFIPIQVTDAGAFPMATTLTIDTNPAFLRVEGSTSLPTPVFTR